MKILLINPCCLQEAGRDLYSAHLIGPLFKLQPNTTMTLGVPLALPTLAAHTPAKHTVKIIDEEIELIDFTESVDLVGLTAMTFKATRAYEIANEYRRRGVKVVMGGIHASMCPEEALAHVDCVVIGEAEELWPQLLADAEAGELRQIYSATGFPDLIDARPPRYDLVRNRQYLYSYLQTTRGCPYDCNFCTVTRTSGRKIRKKTPEQVVTEVDLLLRQHPSRQFRFIDRRTGSHKRFVGMIAFIDDNFAIDRNHALAVCAALQSYQEERGIVFFWYTQVNYPVGLDDELLTAFEAANCQHLFIGFENLDPQLLQAMNKFVNSPEHYAEAIRNIHRHNMRVVYSTIIGVDGSTWDSASHLWRFVEEQRVLHVLVNILTPYPGTTLATEMEQSRRILTRAPQLYNIRNVVFRPEGMSPGELLNSYRALCQRLFGFRAAMARSRDLLDNQARLVLPLTERVGFYLGLSFSCLLLASRRRLRLGTALRLLLEAPRHILVSGSLPAIERLVSCADYDDFASSENQRLSAPGSAAAANHPATGDLVDKQMRTHQPQTPGAPGAPGQRGYRACHISSALLRSRGTQVSDRDAGRPILVLGGTSLKLNEMSELINRLMEAGYEVACLEHPLGGLRDAGINPRQERPRSLRDYLDRLQDSGEVRKLDILAQSYAAFDVVRALADNPAYLSLISSIILVTPPGFDEKVNYLNHCLRFLWGHTLKGYLKARWGLLGRTPVTQGNFEARDRLQRQAAGIRIWFANTLRNPVRTLRELIDIINFRLALPLETLHKESGYDINIFLQTEDRVIPSQPTLRCTASWLPRDSVRQEPGGHNDVFFQKDQQNALLKFIREVREKIPGQTSQSDWN
jgi:radical SAM superfamily enzyme YgiQ (UPF0313 family)